MRVTLFTATFSIILAAVLLVGELRLREDRAVMRMYTELSEATEKALDDTCEYLGIVPEDGNGIGQNGAAYLESIFEEALAASLGIDVAVRRDMIKRMTDIFAVFDGKGSLIVRSKRNGDDRQRFENIKSNDEAAALLSGLLGQEIFLPDNTDMIGNKAADGRSLLVCLKCHSGSLLSNNKDIVIIRNAQIKKKTRQRELPGLL